MNKILKMNIFNAKSQKFDFSSKLYLKMEIFIMFMVVQFYKTNDI